MMISQVLIGMLCAATLVAAAFGQLSPPMPHDEELPFRYIGPESSGRVAAAAGVEGGTQTYYADAAPGGVWKTSDVGKRWNS